MTIPSLAVAFAAGALTILSPCVLPLVPTVLGSAAAENRAGPVALAAGVGLSFAIVGGLLASLGFEAGLEGSGLRWFGGAILLALGLVLIVPALQARLAEALGPLGTVAGDVLRQSAFNGIGGQFVVGLLLGAVWTPCAGPTLGAASLLASRGEELGSVSLTMLMFGLGTALSLAALGLMSRAALMRWRGNLMSAARGGKIVLGIGLALVGIGILTGAEKSIEAWLVDASPLWLTQLSTRL